MSLGVAVVAVGDRARVDTAGATEQETGGTLRACSVGIAGIAVGSRASTCGSIVNLSNWAIAAIVGQDKRRRTSARRGVCR